MIDTLAWAGLLGISPERIIEGDAFGARLRMRVVERAAELRLSLDDSLALKIVNRFSEAWNKGGSGG
jgi:hypothetical protein